MADDLEVTAIAPGIWLHTTWRALEGGRRFPSNGLVVRNGREAVLVDTAWGTEPTERLLEWIDGALGLQVTAAVATHFHDDRLGGAPALARRGISVSVSEATQRLARNEDRPYLAALGQLAPGQALAFGPLELFFPGPAHT